MRARYLAPVPLTSAPGVAGFHSASEEQNQWLSRYAFASHSGGHTKVHVVTEEGAAEVVAYFAWRMAQVSVADAPGRASAGGGRYPVPMALLARLAVDERHEGGGLGRAVLRTVLRLTAEAGVTIGCRGLLVHCESDAARAWYLHQVPAFESSPTDPLHLVLVMKDLRRAVEGVG